MDELNDQIGGSRTLLGKVLEELIAESVVVRQGRGVKGSAFKYCLADSDSSAAGPLGVEETESALARLDDHAGADEDDPEEVRVWEG